MAGALYGRFIGCTLGVPVEGWEIAEMKGQAEYLNMSFPPIDYWEYTIYLYHTQYNGSFRSAYTKSKIDGVPVDDVTYNLVGLLILEKYDIDYTTEDVSESWKE